MKAKSRIKTCGDLREALSRYGDECPIQIYIGGIRNMSGWLDIASIDPRDEDDPSDPAVDLRAQLENYGD